MMKIAQPFPWLEIGLTYSPTPEVEAVHCDDMRRLLVCQAACVVPIHEALDGPSIPETGPRRGQLREVDRHAVFWEAWGGWKTFLDTLNIPNIGRRGEYIATNPFGPY